MKIKQTIFSVIILIGCFFTACTPDPAPEVLEANNPLIDKITTQPQCPLPCWRGIIPGTSSMEEASDLIQASPAIEHLTQYFLDYYDVIEWTFADSMGVGKIEAGFGGQKDTVRRIYFSTQTQNITLHQVIANFGEPDYLFFCKNADWDIYYLEIVYPEKNMVVDLGMVSTLTGRVKLTGDESVNSIALIAPDYFDNAYPLPTETEHTCALTWEGYGTYKFARGRVGK